MRKILRRIFAQLVTLPPTIGLRINESGCRKNSFEAPHHGHETEDGISGKRRKGSAWWWGTDRDDESNEDFSSLGGKHGNYLLYDGMGGQSVRPFIKLNERIQRWTRRAVSVTGKRRKEEGREDGGGGRRKTWKSQFPTVDER